MEHWVYTNEVKESSRKRRRLNSKKIARQAMKKVNRRKGKIVRTKA